MTYVFRIGNFEIQPDHLPSILHRYQLLPQLFRQLIIEQAIAPFKGDPEQYASAQAALMQQNNIRSQTDMNHWLQRNFMTPETLDLQINRSVRLNQFKSSTFGPKVETYFFTRKPHLDRIFYSLLRTKDPDLAQELYFRIKEGEATFAELSRQFSQGMEADTGGMIGPTTLAAPHPAISHRLAASQPGQLLMPFQVNEWLVILRLEKRIPAELDEEMRERIIDELFEQWLQEQVWLTYQDNASFLA